MLQTGIDCKNRNEVQAALAAFHQAIEEDPRCSLAYWLLGGMHYSYRKDPKAALPYYRKSVRLSPRSEKASLGLFHSLWRLNRQRDAMKELLRYLNKAHSADYEGILEEVQEKAPEWLPRRYRKTIAI